MNADRPADGPVSDVAGLRLGPEADARAEYQQLLAQAARGVGEDSDDLRLDQHGAIYHSRRPLPNARRRTNRLQGRGGFQSFVGPDWRMDRFQVEAREDRST